MAAFFLAESQCHPESSNRIEQSELLTETIGGPLFPLFASQIPSFDTSFEQFTLDLKQAAEAGNTR